MNPEQVAWAGGSGGYLDVGEGAVAVVGLGCRLPGAQDHLAYWGLLSKGENHLKPIPEERWSEETFYHPDPDHPGTSYTRHAGFLTDYDKFDNRFFGINDLEAARMDPQQRYALEGTHMALENAGLTREAVAASRTGVYIGVMNGDYARLCTGDLKATNAYTVTGCSLSLIANRVSFAYDLRGPSLVLDTACSSSLVAIHLGVQAIRAGECDMALCGGVNSILLPDTHVLLTKTRMTSPTGQSQAFSDTADGYARSEGCGMVLLKPLAKALQDGDRVWAVVGSGCNQDGRAATPITAPSASQQVGLLQQVYQRWQVDPDLVDYIEAHGTGTPLGDPVEVRALGEFFGKTDRPRVVGSLKTNVGHLESAAGVAGLIKLLLMIQHRQIAPTLLFSDLNPKLHLDRYGFEVPTALTEWTVPEGKPRVACVNSFGFGGSNSHMVVQEFLPPREGTETAEEAPPERHVLAFSGSTRESLQASLADFFQNLRENVDSYKLRDVALTSTLRRQHLAFRLTVQGSSLQEVAGSEQRLMQQASQATSSRARGRRVVYVFCGVGTAWPAMGRQLLRSNAVFRQVLQDVDAELAKWTDISMLQVLESGDDKGEALLSNLAIFAVQVGLAALWTAMGVLPDVVVGASLGEVAAAMAAGRLTLAQAVRVAFLRSKHLATVRGGSMAVVGQCNPERLQRLCKEQGGEAAVAVYSSPASCTLAGPVAALEELQRLAAEEAEAEGEESPAFHRLSVDCAYHTHHVKMAAEGLERDLADLDSEVKGQDTPALQVPIISTMTGRQAGQEDFRTAAYWRRNVLQPVLLEAALRTAVQDLGDLSDVMFLEIGPRPFLRTHLKHIFPGKASNSLASMLLGREAEALTTTTAALYQRGVDVSWEKLQEKPGPPTDIPRYAFHRQGTLFKPDAVVRRLQGVASTAASDGHPFVSQTGRDAFKVQLSPRSTPFVFQHHVGGSVVVQGATYGEVALAVGRAVLNAPVTSLAISVSYKKMLMLQGEEVATATVETAVSEQERRVTFTVKFKGAVTATGEVWETSSEARAWHDLTAVRARCPSSMDRTQIYKALEQNRITFGEMTNVLHSARIGEDECVVEVHLPDSVMQQAQLTSLHPCLLDAMAQCAVVLTPTSSSLWLPAGMKRVLLHRPPSAQLLLYLKRGPETASKRLYSGLVLTPQGNLVLEMQDLVLETRAARSEDTLLAATEYGLVWRPLESGLTDRTTRQAGAFLLMSSCPKVRSELARVLSDQSTEEFDQVDALERRLQLAAHDPAARVHAVVFCCPDSPDLANLQEAQEAAENVTWLFLSMVRMMSKPAVTVKPRLVVVTRSSQVLDLSALPETPLQPLGAALWAAVRSVLREFTYDDIRTIDLTLGNQEEKLLLRSLLCPEGTGLLMNVAEVKILGSRAYCNEFQVSPDFSAAPSRTLFYHSSQPVELLSSSRDNVSGTVCRVSEIPRVPDFGQVRVAVTRAFVFSPDVIPPTHAAMFEEEAVWVPGVQSHHAVLTSEVQGHVTGSAGTPGQSVAVLSAMTLASHIDVPADAVFPLEGIPYYSPGLLTRLHLLLTLARPAAPDQEVAVVHAGDPGKEEVELLAAILKQRGHSATQVLHKDDLDKPLPSVGVVLTTVKVTSADVTRLLSAFPGCQQLVVFSHLLSPQARNLVERRHNHVTLTAVHADLALQPRELQEGLASVKDWLTHRPAATALDRDVPPPAAEREDRSAIAKEGDGSLVVDVELLLSRTSRVLPSVPGKVFLKSGVYVITGGHSGLGWAMARMVASRGAGVVVCTSRSAPSADLQREMEELGRQYDCDVISLPCDVTDVESVRRLLREVDVAAKGGVLRGIFHNAAVYDDGLLLRMTKDKLANTMRPKVLGTLALHAATLDVPLDFFATSSSISAIYGNNGQTGYSAANATQDALLLRRRQLGLPAQVVNWGGLQLGILDKDQTIRRNLLSQGFGIFEKDEIEELFMLVLASDSAQRIFTRVNWHRAVELSQTHMKSPHLSQRFKTMLDEFKILEKLTCAKEGGADPNKSNVKDDPSTQLSATECVQRAVQEVFVVEDGTQSWTTRLFDLGIDSMLVMAFIDRLAALSGGVKVPLALMMDEEATLQQVLDAVQKGLQPENSQDSSARDGHAFLRQISQTA